MDHQIASLGKFLKDNKEYLLTFLVPFGHYAWNRYNIRNRKRTLRRQIAEFVGQRESLAKVSGLTHGDSILQDLEDDLKAAMAELAPGSAGTDPRRGLGLRPTLARWFLLYKPPGVLAWPLHLLFYLNLLIVLMVVLGTTTHWDANSPYALVGGAVLLTPAYFFHWLARRRFSTKTSPAASI